MKKGDWDLKQAALDGAAIGAAIGWPLALLYVLWSLWAG